MYLPLIALNIAGIALGAGATFVNDLFFIFTAREHHVKKHEIRIIKRFNLAGLLCAGIVVLTDLFLLLAEVATGVFQNEGVTYAKILILAVLFAALLAMRNVHLPALERAQEKHRHLSESFFSHHDGLIATAVISITSWLFIITIFTLQNQGAILDLPFTILTYLLAVYALVRTVLLFKKRF